MHLSCLVHPEGLALTPVSALVDWVEGPQGSVLKDLPALVQK